jgi:hypothetical protein
MPIGITICLKPNARNSIENQEQQNHKKHLASSYARNTQATFLT